jgi:pyruvate dehydrogenase E2 component (dihydrolipoamide acetyltransferase)
MPAEVIMPALGMAQETGKVLRWLRREGDVLVKGEPLLEVETDKVTVEIEAPAAGTLTGVSAAEGAEVPVGTVIAFVLAEGESSQPVEPVSAPAVVADEPRLQRRALASPKARRLAHNVGVAIDALVGSGPNGAVVAADVEAARVAVAQPHVPAPDLSPLQVGSVWRVMADRVTRSWQEVPQFVLGREVDATRLESWRAAAQRKPGSEKASHTDLLVKICAEALRRHPRVNSSWHDGSIVTAAAINVGIAVATEDGLVVPVVHDADTLDLAAISARRQAIAEDARSGRLRPADLQGGTFTISNLGMYGVDYFQAIVNAPQAAILAVGRILERPAVVNGMLVARPSLVLSLSFDHRVVDGARGAQFLDTLAVLIEEPAGLVA